MNKSVLSHAFLSNVSLFPSLSQIHARGHAIHKERLPCVADQLGDSASRLPSARRTSSHYLDLLPVLLLVIQPSQSLHQSLPASAWRLEADSTEDVLCDQSHDHPWPWQQVSWPLVNELHFCSWQTNQMNNQPSGENYWYACSYYSRGAVSAEAFSFPLFWSFAASSIVVAKLHGLHMRQKQALHIVHRAIMICCCWLTKTHNEDGQ